MSAKQTAEKASGHAEQTESAPVSRKSSRASAKSDTPKKAESTEKLALIRIRGEIGVRHDIKQSLDILRLRKKHICVVIPNTPVNRGQATICKDFITYGKIEDDTYKLLVEKRGEKDSEGKLKPFFRLHPPRGGFERKGIKAPFSRGGVLGYRGEFINELIRKML